jgi:hypothetical protein
MRESNSQKTVMSFLSALNKLDFNAAKELVQPEMKFEGVMGSRDGADSYFTDMEKMKLKYDVKKSSPIVTMFQYFMTL